MSISNLNRGMYKIATTTLVLWVLLVAAGCKTIVGNNAVEKYNQNPLTVVIPNNVSPQDLEEAMTETLIGRKWMVVQRSSQEVVGELDHRGFQARVILKVDANLIKILNHSHYKVAPSRESPDVIEDIKPGTPPQSSDEIEGFQPAIPMGWLQNLQNDLNLRLRIIALK